MGYEPKPKTYRLKFEDHDGLEVVCTSLTIGEFLDAAKLADGAGEGSSDAVTGLLATFAEHLAEWNVTRKGRPVKPDLAGVKTQHLDFVLEIITAWMGAIASVDNPLPRNLNGGGTSDQEQPLHLAAFSKNLGS